MSPKPLNPSPSICRPGRARAAALAALLGGLIVALPAQAGLDVALLEAARKAQPAVVESLKDMVTIESGSANAEGLTRMADYTERRLKELGAQTERIKATRGPGTLVKGTFDGTGTKRLMMIAHMDTVYPVNTLASQPYRLDGNKLYGPGIADDKGGIAVILHSLQILKDAGWRGYARLTVLFNPDEEIGSVGSGEAIAALADEHDVVLSYEPTAAKAVARSEGILLGAAGTASVTLEVKGRSSHAGAAPELGRNALIELAHQLEQTRDVAKGVPGTQLNWTTAQAGVVRNQIPELATAGADVRLTVPDGAAKLKAALQAKVDSSRLVPDTVSTITMEVGRPPFLASEAARARRRTHRHPSRGCPASRCRAAAPARLRARRHQPPRTRAAGARRSGACPPREERAGGSRRGRPSRAPRCGRGSSGGRQRSRGSPVGFPRAAGHPRTPAAGCA